MAVDFFLDLGSTKGEAQDKGHEGQIKLHSWSWGASQTSSVSGTGGSGAGKASLSDLSIMKDYDKASPELFKLLVTGKHIDKGTLYAIKSGGDNKEFLKVEFTELFVTSQQVSASSEIPSESVSFSYNTINITYSTQDDSGSLSPQNPIKYDLKTNVQS